MTATDTKRRPYYTWQGEADCEWCGAALPEVRHWRTLFCGKKCSNAYFADLEKTARAEARAALKCEQCGQPIKNAPRQDRRFCGSACQTKAWHIRRAAEA